MKNQVLKVIRFTSLLLVILLFLPTFSLWAVEAPEGEVQGTVPEGVTVVSEDESKRAAFEKHYLLSDGTYYAVSYAEAVHEQDEQGNWVDVDAAPAYDSKDSSYKVKGKQYSADFDTAEGKASLVNKKGKALTWHYELIGASDEKAVMKLAKKNAKAGSGKNASPKGKKVSDQNAFELPQSKGELLFEDAFGAFNAEVRYTVSPQKIKEDVILYEKGAVYALCMVVENCDYKARLEDNAVIFEDGKGNAYFYIDAPLMYDAAGASSTDVQVLLKQTGKTVTITYTPNKEWLNSTERVYPVTFDPAVTTEDYQANMEDTYVNSAASKDYSASSAIYLGTQSNNEYVGYLRINDYPETGSFPIINATLTLQALSGYSYFEGNTLRLYEIEYNGSFSNLHSVTEFGTVYEVDEYTIADATDTTYEFNVLTSRFLVKKSSKESICYRLSFKDTVDRRMSVASSEHTSKGPVLTVCYGYQVPEGLLTNNTLNGDNSCYLCDTAAIGSGKNMLTVSGNTFLMTAYTGENMDLNSFFLFVQNSDETAMHLFAYYAQQYVNVSSESAGTAVSIGTAQTEWIQIKVSSGYHLLVLKNNPMLALTRSSSGLTIQQISEEHEDDQEWHILQTQSSQGFDAGTIADGIYYFNNLYTRTFLVYDGQLACSSATVGEYGDKMAWNVTHVGNGYYTIESMENRGMFLHMTASEVTLERITAENVPDAALFSFVGTQSGVAIKGKQSDCYLYSINSVVISSASVYSWRLCFSNSYTELSSFSISDSAVWLTLNKTKALTYTPSSTSADFIDEEDFKFSSSNTNAVKVLTEHGKIQGTAQGGISTVTITHLPTGKVKNVLVKVGALQEGSYFIRNKETDSFLRYVPDLHNWVSVGEMSGKIYDGNNDDYYNCYYEWELTILEDGFYKISCRKLSHVLGIVSEEEPLSGSIYWQVDNGSILQKWKPVALSSGGYKLVSASTYGTASEKVITAYSDNTVIQNTYTSNTDLSDEWDLAYISTELPIDLEAQENSTYCWLAATKMFASNYNPDATAISQSTLRNHVGSGSQGTTSNIATAINRCLESDSTEISFLDRRVFDEEQLSIILENSDPVFVGIMWYSEDTAPTESENGHAIVLYGICEIDDQLFFMARDPGPEVEGTTRIVTWSELYNNYLYHKNNQDDSIDNDLVGIWEYTFVKSSYENDYISSFVTE